jgi:putative nucleotidyltransferase with HDIG domain
MTDPLEALAELHVDGWLVGGALRDRLLGRPTADYDVVVAGDPRPVARSLGRSAGGHPFQLSEGFGAWRVVSHARDWQVDLLPLGGETIEADLQRRDFTINAIAEPVGGGERVDPFGGLEDLSAGRLRMVSATAFEDDPLRTLRLARMSCELGFDVDPRTLGVARESAPALAQVAPERVFAELKRIVISDAVLDGLELMDRLGATDVVLPELVDLRGVQQSPYHHLDVHGHTRAVLAEAIELEHDPEPALGVHAEAASRLLAEPLANELTRGQALRFGALLHDIAKPQTRDVTTSGRVTFIGHDQAGAQVVIDTLGRLRAGERLSAHVAALVRNHLRLGFLVHDTPLSRRAIYRYLRACDPVQVDVTVLSVADRLATRGSGSDAAIAKHLELAQQLLGEALAWLAEPPRPPVRGDELARALGVRPGPELGRVLRELEEASFAGEIDGRDQAIERAAQLLAGAE